MLPATSERVEGRVESVDAKKGVVVVRLPNGEVLEAGGAGLAEGDKVTLQKNAEGAWIARLQPAVRASTGNAASATMPAALLSMGSAGELAQALASGESSRIRAALSSLALEISASSPRALPEELVPARNRGLSPLVSLGAASTGPTGTIVPLVLLEERSSGVYGAEAAGRATTLLGAAGLPIGSVGLWTESVVSAVASLWLPVDVGSAELPALPAQVSADASGARRLLDSLGVSLSDTSDESFRSLVRSLARASLLGDLARPEPAAPAVPTTSVRPASTGMSSVAPSATAPSDVPVDPAPAAFRGGAMERGAPVPGGVAAPAAGRAVPMARSDADLAGGGVPRLLHGDPAGATTASPGARSGAPASPGASASFLATAMTDPVLEELVRSASSFDDSRPAAPVPSERADAPLRPDASAPMDDSPRTLPAAAALRVACAWALSPQEPSDEILAAAVGAALELPEAVHRLAEHASRAPTAFPEVTAFLARSDAASPLMPSHLGLEKAVAPDEDSRPLSHAVAGDLARALSEQRGADAQVLREALRSLVGEGLDAAKDSSNPMASAPWTMPPRGERPDAGRLVVRDRRRSRDGAPDRTVVDVTMNPTGLGVVGARLEAVGKELDVRFRAAESATSERIREALPELRRILTGLGYGTRELGVDDGRPTAPPSEPRRPGSAGLLDIRA